MIHALLVDDPAAPLCKALGFNQYVLGGSSVRCAWQSQEEDCKQSCMFGLHTATLSSGLAPSKVHVAGEIPAHIVVALSGI